MTRVRSWIVVPDGLAADAAGRASDRPSFVYRQVLDRLTREVDPGDRILLAPANRFGGEVSEQEAARRYLAGLGRTLGVVCFEVDDGRYVDTRGNARLLRRHLEDAGEWPLEHCVLVSYHRHLPRARIVFRQEGFVWDSSLPVRPEAFVPEPIVGRLWYYRFPALHTVYELGARLLSRLRLI
jgi:uncharacterized SAM-binding protein YcdF (DUF218 family)